MLCPAGRVAVGPTGARGSQDPLPEPEGGDNKDDDGRDGEEEPGEGA